MSRQQPYIGIDQDHFGGMTPTGSIVRDAWVFGLIPETETCAGWTVDRIQALYDKVHAAWKPYAHLASRLPPELGERHARIYERALARAKELGWSRELLEDE